ncbi:hypothetical protein BB561_000640 [Smittium simulii]|uniref:Endonuclease/exonuclease/phosphatase domain-containing protein n=1 Tax=Smittium simulii TaxID=133385 RepID=A0A2T9YYB5_9FUNG|nr:hypothetical protein BB561_000640 [Smittium simulii]
MTFSVHPIYNKVEDLELILNKNNPAVLLQNRSSWGISELRNEYSWMSVKINSKAASGKENEIIVINIHTPHLATEKKIMKKQIELYLQKIVSKNENKKIILAGDFNMDTKSTINWVNKIGVGLTRMPVFNSRGSRLNGIKMGRMIDHICSVNLHFQFIGASVIKNVDISDHFPINSVWINSEITLDAEKAKKIDRKRITVEADKIISHNYYAVLSEYIESSSDTNTILKINKPIKDIHRPELPKKIIKAIKKRRLAFKKMLFEENLAAKNQQFLKFKKLKSDTLKLLKVHRKKNMTKRQIQAIECALNHENRSTWRYIKSNFKYKKNTTTTTAVINENFELIGGKKESLAVWANHFARLAQTTSIGNTNFEVGISCNWMGLELVYPELKTHINYVFKILNGTYWTARRYAKSGFIEKRFIEECPFCRNIAPETIEHILLGSQVATKPPLLPASISMRLVSKLLGEELKLSSTRICKDPTVLCEKYAGNSKVSKRNYTCTLHNSL